MRVSLRDVFLRVSAAVWLTGMVAGSAAAQAPPAGSEEGAAPAMLARKLANPLADMVSVPLQFNWVNGVGPEKDLRQVVNLQPVIPFSVSSGWNVIGRVVMPLVSQPAALGSSTGPGDVVASAFLSPAAGAGRFTWGLGPVVSVPTTTDPTLGTAKWSAGPTAIVMVQHGPITAGALANQLWSFAGIGETPRAEVSQLLFQPVVSLVTPSGVTFTLTSEMTANWQASEGDVWTARLMGMVSRITRLGPLPVSLQAGGGVYLAAPEGGPRWQVRSGVVVILPKRRP